MEHGAQKHHSVIEDLKQKVLKLITYVHPFYTNFLFGMLGA
jgi:hypothetical protein